MNQVAASSVSWKCDMVQQYYDIISRQPTLDSSLLMNTSKPFPYKNDDTSIKIAFD